MDPARERGGPAAIVNESLPAAPGAVAACLVPLSRMPLLAQLARYDWFTRVGEPAITQFLNGLLDEPSFSQAITALVARRSGRDSYNVVQGGRSRHRPTGDGQTSKAWTPRAVRESSLK